MNRPHYETQETLDAEEKIANTISELWKAKLSKLPIRYKLDYAAERNGRIVAWIEIKTRKYKWADFDTFMLSLDKYLAAVELGKVTNLPVTLVVKWVDKVGYVDLLNCTGVVKMGGRNDRNDTQDVQPVIYIPMNNFRELETSLLWK